MYLLTMGRDPLHDAHCFGLLNSYGKSIVIAYKVITDLEKAGFLEEITGARKGKIYVFKEYLNLFKCKSN